MDERSNLRRIVRDQDFTPTVRDRSASDDSTALGEDLTTAGVGRRRPIPFHRRLKNHIVDHWFGWLCGVVLAIVASVGSLLMWFTHDARLHFASLDQHAKDAATAISELKSEVKAAHNSIQDTKAVAHETRARVDQTQSIVNVLLGSRLRGSEPAADQKADPRTGTSTPQPSK